ncbi:MAG: YkgJ family cysteine cluster protein [Thermodesulfobacteriota bacterium]
MKINKKIQAISSQAGNSRQWLAEYLSNRAHLAAFMSDFHCDSACTRPGCKNQDLQVPVSLIDIVAAALHRDEPVSVAYQTHYSLGLLSNGREDWIRIVTLRLQKPCPFLENDLCSIYLLRPLPCMLFPEYLVHEGTFEANARKDHFKDYLCFRRPLHLSPERFQVIAQLRRMWERESLISTFYLLNHGTCHLDFSNLVAELLRETENLDGGESKGRLQAPRTVPHHVMERYFLERIARCQPIAGVSEKIYLLDQEENQNEFFQFLQDDLLVKKLKANGDGRALVFRFLEGKLTAKRRSISPPEYKFFG